MLSRARAAATTKAKAQAQAVARRGLGTQIRWKQDKPQSRRIPAREAAVARHWPKLEIPRHAKRFTYDPETSEAGPVTVAWTDKLLYVDDPATENGRRALKPATLRDSCACPRCRDASSGQKTYSSVEIPVDIGLEDVRPTAEGLAISFSSDIARFVEDGREHVMLLPWQSVDLSLKRRGTEYAGLPRRRSVLRRTGVVYWDRDTIARRVRRVDYADFMRDGSDAFWDVVVDICRFGIVFLKDVPRDDEAVVRIATRIANIRETLYGRSFDVRAKPNAENVAYTSGYLGLHQDLLYLDPPPMVQVLHCMDNSCAGGESLFSDGERVGRLLWPFVDRHSMAPLAEHRVPYQYGKNGHHYFGSRRVLDGGAAGLEGVYWSPPFQGRYLSPVKDIRPWIEPARIFASLISHPDAVHEHKMEPGECVLFDNLRVLHGRNAFDAAGGGDRWLRGAYIAAEDFLSRASHIPEGVAEKYRGDDQPWTPGLAQKLLRESPWHQDVVRRVRELDPGLDEPTSV